MEEEVWSVLEQAIARDKSRKYFTEALPKIVTAIIDPAARGNFSGKNQAWLQTFVVSAFKLQDGVVVGANLAQVIKLARDFYTMHQIIFASHQVSLQFDADLLSNSHLQGISSCLTHNDYQWAESIDQTF